MMTEERRLKLFYVPQGDLIRWLNRGDDFPEYITVPVRLVGVPEGSRVHHLIACPERRAIGVVVSHESFDEVPEGEQIPREDEVSLMEYRLLKVVDA